MDQPKAPGETRTDQPLAATTIGRQFPEFSDLVLSCRHHLPLTLAIGSVASIALAALAYWVIEPRYRAEGFVRVREQQNVVFAPQTSRAEDVAFFRSQEKLATSPQVLSAALTQPEVVALAGAIPEHNQAAWLAKLLEADTESGSEVMSITVIHRSPHVAQTLSNAVTKSYLAEVTHRIESDRHQRYAELERAAHEADQRLDQLWDDLHQMANTIGSDSSESLTIREEMRLQTYRDYSRQLHAAQRRGNELQTLIAEQRSVEPTHEPEVIAPRKRSLVNHPEVIAIRKKLSQISTELDELRQLAASDDVVPIRRLLAQQKHYMDQHDQLIVTLEAEAEGTSAPVAPKKPDESITQLARQIEVNRSEKQFLREQLERIESELSTKASKSAVPLDMTRHAVKRQTRLADGLWQSLQELRIEGQSQPRVTLVSLADMPSTASHSRQLRAAAVAGSIGWVITILGIGYWEWSSCRVRTPRDLRSRTLHPVFGQIEATGVRAALGLRGKQSSPEDSVREAAARLILTEQHGGQIPTITVTSTVAEEPRHHIACELAKTMREFNRRVLLIDCDSATSELSVALGAYQSIGLRQLAGPDQELTKDGVQRLVLTAPTVGVDFIPIGRGAADQWVDPNRLRFVIDTLRADYDAIIVNGPPAIGSGDFLLIGSQTDATYFAVFVDQSRWSHVVSSQQSADQAGLKIGGSLLVNTSEAPSWKLMSTNDARPQVTMAPLQSPQRSNERTEETRIDASVANPINVPKITPSPINSNV